MTKSDSNWVSDVVTMKADFFAPVELAVAERGAMYDPSAVFYMNKIAVGPDAVDAIDITAPIGENIRRVAKVKNLSVSDMTVCILDRPRHIQLIADVRSTPPTQRELVIASLLARP